MKITLFILILTIVTVWLSTHFYIARAFGVFPLRGGNYEIGIGTDVGDVVLTYHRDENGHSERIYYYTTMSGHNGGSGLYSWTYPTVIYEPTDFRPHIRETVFGKFLWQNRNSTFIIGVPIWAMFLLVVFFILFSIGRLGHKFRKCKERTTSNDVNNHRSLGPLIGICLIKDKI